MTTASQRLDLAQRRLAAGDAQGAHHLCLEALADNREDDGAWFLLGMIAADHGNPAKAIELFTKAAALAPRTARYLAQLGRVLIALNHRPEASSAAERALDLEPQDALTLDTIGVPSPGLVTMPEPLCSLNWRCRATLTTPVSGTI